MPDPQNALVAGCRVREVRPSDAAEWLRMRQLLLAAEEHAREIADYFASRWIQPAAVFVAERSGGGLAGFIEVGTRLYAEGCESSPVGYIEAWYVDADVRRAGLGAALVRAAEAWARDRGCSEMGSDVELGNAISQQAHRALGYDEVERIVCFRRSLSSTGGGG